jgi:chromosome segregation ATPase
VAEEASADAYPFGDQPAPVEEDTAFEPVEGEDAPAEEPAKADQSPAALANSAGQQLMEGLAAVRNVRELSRKHSNARAQLDVLRRELDDAMVILDHRVEIERNYDQIVAEQTALINEAKAEMSQAEQRAVQLAQERDQLSARLTALKAENVEALRPYKNLMDTTKGRSDDAAVALADARRAVRSAESQATEATRRRDQRVAAANRTVDNAQERLRRVQTELDKLQGDPDAPMTALPKMRDELVAERAHLEDAREEVERVTAESQQLVEESQARLFSLKQTLESAERVADETKREATSSREEYDRLYKEARASEEEVEAAIKERTAGIAEAKKERDAAAKRIDEYQIVLDEANDIRETPEVTAQLRDRITAGKDELERQNQEVRSLAQSERDLRESTRTKRIVFFAVIAAVVLLAILLIWFLTTR